MTLAERIAQLRELEAKADKQTWADFDYWIHADYINAMRNAIGPLIHVVEQQREAIQGLLDPATNEDGEWYREARNAARAALALLDKEDGNAD